MHTFRLNAVFGSCPQPDRTINTRAGIPAGIRLLCDALNTDRVLAVNQIIIGINKEWDIAIACSSRFFPVKIDGGISVNTLELNQHMLRIRFDKFFLIYISAAREKGSSASTGCAGISLLMNHGIVRQCNGLDPDSILFTKVPSRIK